MSNKEQKLDPVYVSDKDVSKYISACLFELSEDKDEVLLTSRGHNIKRAIDVAAIMLRQYLDLPKIIPTYADLLKILEEGNVELAKECVKKMMCCEVVIGSEEYLDPSAKKKRYVSILDITLRGKKKNGES